MRVSGMTLLALGVAAYDEETAMLQVKGDQSDVHAKPVKYTKKYTKAAYGKDHADVVLPDPVWLKHSEDSELVIRNCRAHGAKECSTFYGGKALMDSMNDDTDYGYGTGHHGKHCCVEKVKQCETKYVSHCKGKKRDLTVGQCKNVAKHSKPLSFQDVVDKKNKFPGCYYRKADGKTFWNSFSAEDGYGKADESHGDRKVYAPICKVRRCKNIKTDYKKAKHPKAYKKVEHPKSYKKVEHPKAYKKVEHPKEYKKVEEPKTYKKVEHPKKYKKVEHPKKYKKVEHTKKYKKVQEPHYHS